MGYDNATTCCPGQPSIACAEDCGPRQQRQQRWPAPPSLQQRRSTDTQSVGPGLIISLLRGEDPGHNLAKVKGSPQCVLHGQRTGSFAAGAVL